MRIPSVTLIGFSSHLVVPFFVKCANRLFDDGFTEIEFLTVNNNTHAVSQWNRGLSKFFNSEIISTNKIVPTKHGDQNSTVWVLRKLCSSIDTPTEITHIPPIK